MLHIDSVPEAVGELLESLPPDPALKVFALGGGTSIALRFGHRLSVDLAFFTQADFDPEAVLLDTCFPSKTCQPASQIGLEYLIRGAGSHLSTL